MQASPPSGFCLGQGQDVQIYSTLAESDKLRKISLFNITFIILNCLYYNVKESYLQGETVRYLK